MCLLRVDTDLGSPLGPDRVRAEVERATAPSILQSGAVTAIRDRPIDGAAFRMLGQAAAMRGDHAKALALYRIASRRDPRDTIARALLMQDSFGRGDAGEGVEHLDAMLRVAPDLRRDVVQALVPELRNAALRQSVVSVMVADPPWSGVLLDALSANLPDPSIAVVVMDELAAKRKLTPVERSLRIDALDRSGLASQAREVWLASLPLSQRKFADNVFDGGFEEPEPISGEFAWTWDAGVGAYLSLEQGGAASGNQSLRIDFDGRSVELKAPTQRLALASGTYVLSAAFDDATDASRPLLLAISCSGARIVSVELTGGKAEAWTRVEQRFEIPDGCAQQRISLALSSRSLANAQISGALRMDDIAIRKALQ